MDPKKRFYPIQNDFRDPYARDRDRVIHCSSFRRLEYKTQVFINTVGDYFRTRLTHSLEVSQIARSIARSLGLNETLAEVIALSHDLGHTPFGHAGGDELDLVLKKDGFKNGFEHNFQSFRVVTSLEKRYKDFSGLNLTFATLEGILKHSYPYKKSFLDSKIDEVFKLDYHPSLEAIVVDSADEIAYVSHDIDDGLKYGLIGMDDLRQSSLVQKVLDIVNKEGVYEGDDVFRYRFSSHMINHLVYSFLENPHNKEYPTNRVLSATIKASEEIDFGFEKELKKEIKALKKILFQKLYKHEVVNRKMYFGRKCIKSLYEAFMSEPNLMSGGYKNLVDEQSDKKHRVVADYIAGMSDRYAMELYKELYVGE
ncbi:MAG: deoxyguanosinetriphosphate triphosphohydrolase family protein [Campylobacterales bacterium]